MKSGWVPCLVAAACAWTGTASATEIRLIDVDGTVKGSKAEEAFRVAADFWETVLAGQAVINIEIGYARLQGGILGTTDNRTERLSVREWKRLVTRSGSRSGIDGAIVLPRLRRGGITGSTVGTDAEGVNSIAAPTRLDGTQMSARYLSVTSSLMKALGGPLESPERADGVVKLNSALAFDFDPTDGVAASGVDIVAVAIHEMGHVLGFGSGVDALDAASAPKGPGRGSRRQDRNGYPTFTALDMFRYAGFGELDLVPGAETYLSFDRGRTAYRRARFSSGWFNGDGNQAGHFKETVGGCAVNFGIMDAGRCGGQMGVVTGIDLAAFDAIGWNLQVDARHFPSLTTKDIVTRYRAAGASRRRTSAPLARSRR